MIRRTLAAAAALFLSATGVASAMLLRAGDGTTPAPTSGQIVTVSVDTNTAPAPAPTTTAPATTPPPAATTTTAPAAPAPPPGRSAVTFVFSGHGWGHGVGMSQWGAKGYADHGWTYDAILAHYYPGTTLGAAPVSSIRVLLAGPVKSLKLGSAGPWTVSDGDGATVQLAPGTLVLGKTLVVRQTASADPQQLQPPLTVQPQGSPLELGKKFYAGTFQVTQTANGKLQLVDTVGLEDYVKGVVPFEMPSNWAPEALKAQAVAARSYALAQRKPAKAFDVYADTRDQVYGGLNGESDAASAAADATAGKVLLYDGQVADTLFSSSSGGRTASWLDSFPNAKPVPYLVSVDDPYDNSPYRNWGPVALDGARAAKALGVTAPLLDITPTYGPTGRIRTAVATTPTGPVLTTGPALRSAFGLRSTWATFGLLSLTAPPGAVPYGSKVTLQGVARGVSSPVLEQRAGSLFWTAGPAIAPGGDGSFAAVVAPRRTTDYRLGTGTLRGATIRVKVAPVVTLAAGGAGRVVPAVAGKSVLVQQQQGRKWVTTATLPVAADGSFSASLAPGGVYRARYAPGGGLVAAASPPVQVS